MNTYYIKVNGVQSGPHTVQELYIMCEQSQLPDETLIIYPGEQWSEATELRSSPKLLAKLQEIRVLKMRYYLKNAEAVTGPFLQEQIICMWRDGRITANMEYWQDKIEVWLPVTDLIESFSRVSNGNRSLNTSSKQEVTASGINSLGLIGIIFMLLGFVVIGYFSLSYDTSVYVDSTYISGYGSVGSGRIQNIGLLNNRQNGIIVGVGISVVGSILLISGIIRNPKQ